MIYDITYESHGNILSRPNHELKLKKRSSAKDATFI